MKLSLLLGLFLMIGTASAEESLRAQKIKQEMLERTDTLITFTSEGRDAIKKKDYVTACQKVNELFELYPDHLKAIGGHMNLFDSDIVKIKNEALDQLITFHKESLICADGTDHEYIRPKTLDETFKKTKKSLEKQKKRIKKSETDYENSFSYEYEF